MLNVFTKYIIASGAYVSIYVYAPMPTIPILPYCAG